ncbi:MAG: DUF327 domain-containing protein [Geobacter sp.]|nr:MAG: DUF327 domain-containing protein [Geobacter sp.]
MRIKETLTTRNTNREDNRKTTLAKGDKSLFAAELNQQQTGFQSYEQEIENLRQEIDRSGERLNKEPTLPNFKQFRDLLSKLAKQINAEAYRLEKIGGTPQNPRYFEIITVINTEADRLYNLIISENKDQLAITAKVIGIKGMVVDLLT